MRQASGLGGGNVKSYGRTWGTKAVAVLLAFVLWLFVFGQQSPTNVPEFTRTLTNIPVEIIGADREFQYLVTPSSVDIIIRGSQEFISSMVGREHRVTVDVRGIQEGIHNLEVVTTIAGGSTQGITPNYVTVIIDPIITRDFTVTVETEGELPDGVSVEGIDINPNAIQLTGPKAELERVTSVIALLNLSEVTKTQSITVPIVIMDIHNRNIDSLQSNISNVIIEVIVTETSNDEEFTINYINLQEGFLVSISPDVVRATVPIDANLNAIQPYVDLDGLEEGTYTLQVQSNVAGINFDDIQVEVTIERE